MILKSKNRKLQGAGCICLVSGSGGAGEGLVDTEGKGRYIQKNWQTEIGASPGMKAAFPAGNKPPPSWAVQTRLW